MDLKITCLVLVCLFCGILANPQDPPPPGPGGPGPGPRGPPPGPRGGPPGGPGGHPPGSPPDCSAFAEDCKEYEDSVKKQMQSDKCEDKKKCKEDAVAKVGPPNDKCVTAVKKLYKLEDGPKSGNKTTESTTKAP